MTIVEEIDKKSGRSHRSKNIVDAMKYLFSASKTPQNIAEAVKDYSGGSEPTGGYMGMRTATISLSTKSFPEGASVSDVIIKWVIHRYSETDEAWQILMQSSYGPFTVPSFPATVDVPVIDDENIKTEIGLWTPDLQMDGSNSDTTGDVEFIDDAPSLYGIYATGDGAIAVAWLSID